MELFKSELTVEGTVPSFHTIVLGKALRHHLLISTGLKEEAQRESEQTRPEPEQTARERKQMRCRNSGNGAGDPSEGLSNPLPPQNSSMWPFLAVPFLCRIE